MSCFWGHHWLKWERIEVPVVMNTGTTLFPKWERGTVSKQRRVCDDCGLIEEREL